MGSKYITYNGNVATDATSVFTRDVATVDDRAQAAAIDARRFGRRTPVATELNWVDTTVSTGPGVTTVLATGFDSDGTTPLALIKDSSNQVVNLFSGYGTPTNVGTFDYNNATDDLLNGAVSGIQYQPFAGVVFYGYVALLCVRKTYPGLLFQGVTIIDSQDKGTTLNRVEMASIDGGGFDIPANSAGTPDTASIPVREWCFKHAFPRPYGSVLSAFLCGCDYIDKAHTPGGGQAFGYRITRADDAATTWTVEKMRLFHELWDGAVTNAHWHAANPCIEDDCIHIHIGDDPDNNGIISVPVDLDNYETATLGTPAYIHGGKTDGTSWHDSPQTLCVAPGRDGSEYLGPSDVSPEQLYRFLPDGDDTVEVKEIVSGRIRDETQWEALNLSWMPNMGWAYGGFSGQATRQGCRVSKNGFEFAEVNLPGYELGNLHIYGTSLLWVDPANSREIHLADFPWINYYQPLQLAPGGTQLTEEFAQDAAPASGNANDEITYDGSQYLDSGMTALTVQPPPPPFVHSTLMMRWTSTTSTDYSFGRQWMSVGNDFDETLEHCLLLWICNLAKDKNLQFVERFGFDNSGAVDESVDVSAYNQWIPFAYYRPAEGGGTSGRVRLWLWSPTNVAKLTHSQDFITAVGSVAQLRGVPYSLAPQATGSDEVETVSGLDAGASWTAAMIVRWPNIVPWINTGTWYLGTLWDDATNYVELSFQPATATTGSVVADFWASGSSAGTVSVALDIQREQVVHIIVSNTGTAQRVTARTGAVDNLTTTGVLTAAISPNEMRWATNNDRTQVDNLDVLYMKFIDDTAWTLAQAQAWAADRIEILSDHSVSIGLNP